MKFKDANVGDHVYAVGIKVSAFGTCAVLREFEIVKIIPVDDAQVPLLRVTMVETTEGSWNFREVRQSHITLVHKEWDTIQNTTFKYYGLSLETACKLMKDSVDRLRPTYLNFIEKDFDDGLYGCPCYSLNSLSSFKQHTAMNVVRLMFKVKN